MAQYKGASTEADRGLNLAKQRENDKIEYENKKKQIKEKNTLKNLSEKFKTHHDTIEAALSDQTVGLVLLEVSIIIITITVTVTIIQNYNHNHSHNHNHNYKIEP